MSDTLEIIRIFIGSPGGLDDERQSAYDVVNRVNQSHSERWGCHLKLIGWEDTVPGYVRPQSKINEDLDRCDYFLGVLWNRWGTKPSTEADGFTSGFEEEFFRARSHIENKKMKDMAIYFKKLQIPEGTQPDTEAQKVLDFRKNCIEGKRVFFKDFEDLNAFQDFVRIKLEEIGWNETKLILPKHVVDRQEAKALAKDDGPVELGSGEDFLIESKAQAFLRYMLKRPSSGIETKPHEIARFRLIASAVDGSGNDDSYLGNHDANLIFKNFMADDLATQEISALIDCGIAGFEHQNVPLWHWVAKEQKESGNWFGRAKSLSIFGSEKEKVNAIKLLTIVGEKIPFAPDSVGNSYFLVDWLSGEVHGGVFNAAIDFLSSNAAPDDIPLIDKVVVNCLPRRRSKLEAAMVRILSRSSKEFALKRLVEKKVDAISDCLAKSLFEKPRSLSKETVISCLSAKSDQVRIRAFLWMMECDALNVEMSETFLTDSNYEIRLLAIESMRKHGKTLDEETVKSALTAVKRTLGLALGIPQSNETNSTYYKRYLKNRLNELDMPALKTRAKEAGVFDVLELSVLYSKYTKRLYSEIRANLEDGFRSHFDAGLEKYSGIQTGNEEWREKVKELEGFIRRQHCTQALNAICVKYRCDDLELVRRVIDEFEVDATEGILNFFCRFGDWSDIDRIVNLETFASDPSFRINVNSENAFAQKAKSIKSVGNSRLAELLDLDIDLEIKRELARNLTKIDLEDLSDEILLRELNRQNDEYRVIVATQCVYYLSKTRISSLLREYLKNDEYIYYNSVNWLDLGASLPRRMVKHIVGQKKLDR